MMRIAWRDDAQHATTRCIARNTSQGALVRACVRACVCVRACARERERARACVCVRLSKHVCAIKCVCACTCVGQVRRRVRLQHSVCRLLADRDCGSRERPERRHAAVPFLLRRRRTLPTSVPAEYRAVSHPAWYPFSESHGGGRVRYGAALAGTRGWCTTTA
jgi:hypothetical protein